MDEMLKIPTDLARIIDLFHGSFNGKMIITHDMDNIDKTRKLSDTFEIGPGYKWRLETDPFHRVGSLDLYLELVSAEKFDQELIIFRRLSCLELKSSYSCISTYRVGTSKGWPYKCLSLNEVTFEKMMGKKHLTFMVEIQILKVVDNIHVHGLYNSNDIIYEYPMYYNPMIMTQQNIKWKIGGRGSDDLMKMTKNTKLYPFKQFESKIFNDMFLIRVAPNGQDGSWLGDFDVYLQLCSFPKGISRIMVLFTTHIAEMNVFQTQKQEFGIQKNTFCWSKQSRLVSFEAYKMYSYVTIYVNIQIIEIK